MICLFDQIKRVDQDSAGHSEPSFYYLNRTARPYFVQIREMLEDWFSKYPEIHKAALRSRFRSPIDAHHQSAFFELLLFQTFHQIKANIEIHPSILGTSRSPDFLVHPIDSPPFILEATVVTFQSADEVAGEARLKQVYDILDRDVDPTNFFIGVDVNSSPKTPPPAKQIAKFINDHLAELDPDMIAGLYEQSGYQTLPAWPFQYNEWSILFRPIPKKPEARGRSNTHPLGTFMYGMKQIDHHTPLRDAVISKARSYGKLPYPFVVAINSLELIDDIDIMSALFGTEKYIIRLDKDGVYKSIPEREPDGVWTSPKGPSRQRVSGVLIASRVRPWSLGDAKLAIFHNPWATFPLRFAINKIQQHVPQEDHLTLIKGQTLSELFGVSWPPEAVA